MLFFIGLSAMNTNAIYELFVFKCNVVMKKESKDWYVKGDNEITDGENFRLISIYFVVYIEFVKSDDDNFVIYQVMGS